jgi:hypothetical protein
MYLITIIGATGQGKSPFIRQYIKGKNCFVYDIQNEYGLQTKYAGQVPVNLSNSIDARRARYTGADPFEFIELCDRKRSTILVFEDATTFFEGKIAASMRKIIFSKAHTKNIILLVFHSINSVPPRILEASDYIVLFKTLDTKLKVKYKNDFLLPAWYKLQKMPAGSNLKIKMI